MFMEIDNNINNKINGTSCPLLVGLLNQKPSPPVNTNNSSPSLLSSSSLTPVDPDLLATLNSPTPLRTRTSIGGSGRRMLDWKLVDSSNASTLRSSDGRSACLHAKCTSCFETEAVRADTPIRANCVTTFEWHVAAHTTAGTSVMFGVCTDSSPLHWPHGYVDLLGSSPDDQSSWALSSRGRLHYAGHSWPYCAPFDDGREHTVACVVNPLAASVEFYVDGKSMGRAFSGRELVDLNNNEKRLYACVSCTTARAVFRLGLVYETYPTLQEMCSYRVQAEPACLWRAFNEFRLPHSMVYTAARTSSSSA